MSKNHIKPRKNVSDVLRLRQRLRFSDSKPHRQPPPLPPRQFLHGRRKHTRPCRKSRKKNAHPCQKSATTCAPNPKIGAKNTRNQPPNMSAARPTTAAGAPDGTTTRLVGRQYSPRTGGTPSVKACCIAPSLNPNNAIKEPRKSKRRALLSHGLLESSTASRARGVTWSRIVPL